MSGWTRGVAGPERAAPIRLLKFKNVDGNIAGRAAPADRRCRPPVSVSRSDSTTPGVSALRRQHLDGIWHQTIQPNKDHAIHGTEGRSSAGGVAGLDVKLMTKGQGLSFQRDPRSEQ
jgi:hypothetical protein